MQLLHRRQRLRAVGGLPDDLVPLRFQKLPCACPKAGVVVDDENSHGLIVAVGWTIPNTVSHTLSSPLLGTCCGLRTRFRLRRSRGEGDLHVEDRAAAVVRLDPEPARHASHELAADVEAEAGPADAAGHVGLDAVELLQAPAALGGR